ncbi:MAG: hypothetical protein HY258_03230 [Chloroflexi bacterium]|nr:hypothetical protein [Chloroflexota bacterium]
MADKKDIMIPPQGMWRGLIMRSKLVLRLLGDKRVSPWLKLIPIGALIYVVSPIDFIMGIPGVDALDDIGVFTFGMYFFIELCPPDVVKEHVKALTSNMDAVNNPDEVVDGEAKDITEKK